MNIYIPLQNAPQVISGGTSIKDAQASCWKVELYFDSISYGDKLYFFDPLCNING